MTRDLANMCQNLKMDVKLILLNIVGHLSTLLRCQKFSGLRRQKSANTVTKLVDREEDNNFDLIL